MAEELEKVNRTARGGFALIAIPCVKAPMNWPLRATVAPLLMVISNISANPTSGTFSNLPDGAIVTINGNNFQASYEGGDGNDLTLTVVP